MTAAASPELTVLLAGAFPFAFALVYAVASGRQPDRWLRRPDERRPAGRKRPDPAPIIVPPCARCTAAARSGRRAARPSGFTLIELLIAVAVAGILSTVAYPSFEAQVLRARRSDVLVAMMQVQLAQERWRSNHAGYGDLAQIGVAAASSAGHYRLQVDGADADGYRVSAIATGAQVRDGACSHLALRLAGANVTQVSGPDAAMANDDVANRRCWSL